MLVCAMRMSLDSSVADDSINIDSYVMDGKLIKNADFY